MSSLRRSRSLRGKGTVNKKEYTFKISTTSDSTASLVYYEEVRISLHMIFFPNLSI